jgi:hypothetical protein
MRKLMLLGAMVAALGLAWQPTNARDRGFSFRIGRYGAPLGPR